MSIYIYLNPIFINVYAIHTRVIISIIKSNNLTSHRKTITGTQFFFISDIGVFVFITTILIKKLCILIFNQDLNFK